nr:hypothetical protein [Bacillus cereus]
MVRVLTQPESGWQRIDDSDRNIIFEGENWFSGYSKYSDNYLKTFHYKSSSQPSNSVQIKFSFVGTKLRLIGLVNNGGYDRYATIVIDGNTERLDYDAWEGTRQAVIYEKTNLNKGPHTVTILGTYLNLDAIDIDSDGYVFTPKKVGEILDKPDPGWNRFDDADSLIKYGDGAWNRVTDDRYYNSTVIYSLTKSVVEFSFKGTGVRLVSKSVNLGYGPVDITIDDVKESYNPVLGSDNWKVLLYNKEGLKNAVHSVKLEGPVGIIMDAIDILDGELVKTAKLGDVLLQPEIGWKRIDDTDVNIKYSGNWTLIDNLPDYHNSTARFKHAKQSSVDNSAMSATFKFKGTKLRVIGVSNNTYDREAQIIIDGKPETISFYADRDVSPTRVLLFDKQGLTDEIHTVELKGVFMHLDAIDIDENGSMVPPAKVGDVLLQPEGRWTRIDDRHSLIKYGSGTWELATDSRYSNSTNTFSKVSCDIEFSFKGTGLRIVSKMITTTSGYGPVDVLIDGVTEKYSITGSSDQWQTLLYEKQGLPDAVHSVKLVASNGIIMDAIDVLGGELVKPPAKVGDLLPQPEMGWKRIDDSDANIKYVGNEWLSLNITEQGHYMDTFHTYPKEGPKSIEFKFTGTKLRVIASKYTTLYDAVSIKIDGVTETYSQQDVSITDKAVSGILVYDKQGLSNTEHSVIITVPDNKPLILDAIDIDATGSMVKPSAKVGDQLLQPETGWTRVDDADPLISYKGESWNLGTGERSSNYYNKTNYFRTVDSPGSLQFSFKGTGIRIVSTLYNNVSAWTDVSVEIDGVAVGKYAQANGNLSAAKYVVLLFEKTGLNDGVHKIKLSGTKMNMDAFDILGGDIVKNQPKQLLQPESGWNRINNSDASINAVGFITGTDPSNGLRNCYMNDHIYSKDSGTVTFEFTGTGLRVLGLAYSNYSNNIVIDIDGVKDTFSEDYLIVPEYLQGSMLVYEKLNLENKKHTVTIHNGDTTKGFGFDAFDIFKPTAKVGDKLTQPEAGWKRIDDTDSNIKYTGLWQGSDSANTGYYNDTMKYKNASVGSGLAVCEFSFTGTKLRVIGAVVSSSQYYKGPVTITIDGIAETYTINNPNRNDRQVLLYEKLNLSPGNHVVKIEAQENIVDAFDIDSNGSIGKPPVTVGDILLQPEAGWNRLNNSDPSITYTKFIRNTDDNGIRKCYMNDYHYASNEGTVNLEFTGTGFRVLGIVYRGYSNNISIEIDGVKATFSEDYPIVGEYLQGSTLVYEMINLENKKHTVKIYNSDITKGLGFDAFDIKSGDTVKSPAKVGDILLEPEPGWKRIDDADTNIKYDGIWALYKGDDYYNSTLHYKYKTIGTDPASIRFNFYGTKLRIIGILAKDYDSNATITIDGKIETINFSATQPKNQAIVYEKLNLPLGDHSVKLDGIFMNLDAIDIDSDDSMVKPPAKVGDILLEPEPGWKRIDDADTNIKYDGKWALYKSDDYYNSTLHYKYKTIGTDPASIRFNFYGTKLRIIGILAKDYDSNATITIDGKTETINFSATQPKNQAIVYEKLNLPLGNHSVKLDGIFMNLDAIDIDSDDSMVKPTAKVGDQLLAPEDGWKRYDDNASEILYDANWAKNVAYSGAYGGKSTSAHKGKNSSFRFKFKGTKFRLIVGCSTTEFYSDKISVRIDDLPLEFFNANAPKDTNQVLKYEKLGLEDKEHEVKVSVVTSQPGAASYDYRFDALDIDDTGSLIKINTVGDVLTEPEKGWKRIDDTDPLIRYIGNWKLTTGNDKHYNKTTHYNLDKKLDTSFEFEFVGTKLRLLAYGDSGYDATSKVLIDGKEETMVYNSPSGNQVIRYEKIGLDRGKHTVKVIGKAMSLDSIDIDADGYLLARLGDKLVEPEPGWVRFDDTHKNIEYNGFWKTTEGDVSCYNNTHHWKSKEDNNDSTISARFLFKGTKFRLISMTSPSYPEDIELKIDGQKEILKLSGEDMQYQTLAYEKKNLEDMIHVIELSGKYISIDAIDLEEGATLLKLPDEKLKPYQIRSGLIFKEDFDTFDSRWIASPVGSYSLIDRKGYFRMLHNVSRDTLLLADLPNEKEFAFEVSADYTPTHEDDKGGIIVWKNGEENIEFLETEDGTRETTELKWMACKDNEDWTFFSDYGEGFNFYDSDRMSCSKFGVVLKKGSNSKFVNLDIDSIIATRGRKLTIANIAPNISVQMEDKFGGIIFNGNTGYNTGIQITLPSLEFTGKVILTNVEGKELGVIKTTFYGGDVYGFGSNLEIKFSGEELSTLAQTRLPDMISGKSEIMLELVNPSVARANNVNLSIAQYEDKFGWSWADLALDSNGKPGQYQDSINIPYVNPEKTIKFWLKVTKGTDYVGLAPLQFQIHLEHE